MSGKKKQQPLDRFVVPRRGPRTQRQSGAGFHDARPHRRRARGDAKRAAIREANEG